MTPNSCSGSPEHAEEDAEVTYGFVWRMEDGRRSDEPLRPVAPKVGGRMRETPPLFVGFKLLNLNIFRSGATRKKDGRPSPPPSFLELQYRGLLPGFSNMENNYFFVNIAV